MLRLCSLQTPYRSRGSALGLRFPGDRRASLLTSPKRLVGVPTRFQGKARIPGAIMSKNPIYQRCVFCNEPLTKSKSDWEHAVPQWLHAYTGNPHRTGNFRMLLSGLGYANVQIPWKEFAAKSHAKCNGRHQKLETNAAPVLKKIGSGMLVTQIDAGRLAAWLDKVRVGLWWTVLGKSGNPLQVPGTFGVSARMNRADRFFRVTRVPGIGSGLNIFGCESLLFHNMPSVFGLRVNELFIVSASTHHMLSERMGFPFPIHTTYDPETGQVDCECEVNDGTLNWPVFQSESFLRGRTFYQAIYGRDRTPFISCDTGSHKFSTDDARALIDSRFEVGDALARFAFEIRTLQKQIARQFVTAVGQKFETQWAPLFEENELALHAILHKRPSAFQPSVPSEPGP